jgi:hypothetical protein
MDVPTGDETGRLLINDQHAIAEQESQKCTETPSEEREAHEASTKERDDKRIDELD